MRHYGLSDDSAQCRLQRRVYPELRRVLYVCRHDIEFNAVNIGKTVDLLLLFIDVVVAISSNRCMRFFLCRSDDVFMISLLI